MQSKEYVFTTGAHSFLRIRVGIELTPDKKNPTGFRYAYSLFHHPERPSPGEYVTLDSLPACVSRENAEAFIEMALQSFYASLAPSVINRPNQADFMMIVVGYEEFLTNDGYIPDNRENWVSSSCVLLG